MGSGDGGGWSRGGVGNRVAKPAPGVARGMDRKRGVRKEGREPSDADTVGRAR